MENAGNSRRPSLICGLDQDVVRHKGADLRPGLRLGAVLIRREYHALEDPDWWSVAGKPLDLHFGDLTGAALGQSGSTDILRKDIRISMDAHRVFRLRIIRLEP